MQADELIERVHLRNPVADLDTAQRAVEVTLHALGGILSAQQAHDLAAQLPRPLGEAVSLTADQPGPADPHQLYERVAQRSGLSTEAAAEYCAAVVAVLRKAVSDGEFTDLVLELPPAFDELVVL